LTERLSRPRAGTAAGAIATAGGERLVKNKSRNSSKAASRNQKEQACFLRDHMPTHATVAVVGLLPQRLDRVEELVCSYGTTGATIHSFDFCLSWRSSPAGQPGCDCRALAKCRQGDRQPAFDHGKVRKRSIGTLWKRRPIEYRDLYVSY
jgi:hypothetical protein